MIQHSADCGQQDQAYLMFPEKFHTNSTRVEAFYPNFYSYEMVNYHNGTRVDGDLLADMMVATVSLLNTRDTAF